MSLDQALSRIAEIQGMIAGPAAPLGQTQTSAPASATGVADPSGFSGALRTASASSLPAPSGATASARAINQARQELARGVRETPDGSNNSPDIARYRTATEGAVSGAPWCAYFVSYLAQQAGAPLGARGQGLGYVPDITAWAKSSGRYIAPSGQIRPGDLILFDQHVGIVDRVGPGNTVVTIEGNSSNRVAQRTHSRSEAVGFVRLG